MNPYGYPDPVWQFFCEAPKAGVLDGPDVIRVQVGDSARQSQIELQVQVQADTLSRARFRALGCPTTIAVGAWLAGELQGRLVAEVQAINAAGIRGGLQIAEDRAHCALLGEDAVRLLLLQLN